MPLHPNMEPGAFLDILRRRKWVILFSVLLIHIGTMVYCILAPDLYQSTMKTPRHPADRIRGDGPDHRQHRSQRPPQDA